MVGPAESDYEETYSTLRYAHKAKYIRNFAKVNVEQGGLIERFETEIAELQQKLSLLTMASEQPKAVKNLPFIVFNADLKSRFYCSKRRR